MTTPKQVDRKWFERRLAELGYKSQAELARKVEVSTSQLSLVLDGKRNAHLDLAKALAQALKVPLLDLAKRLNGPMMDALEAVAEIERGSTLELAGSIDGEFQVDLTPEGRRRRLVRLDLDAPAGAVALEYHTAGTAAAMFNGMVAVVLEKREVDADAMVGRYNVVWLPTGPALMRVVSLGKTPGRFNLSVANCADIEDAEVTHYAPVLAIMAS